MCLQINEKKQSCFVNSCTFFNTITHLKHDKKTFSWSLVQIFSTCYKKRTILFRLKKQSCFVNTCTFFNTITHLKHNETEAIRRVLKHIDVSSRSNKKYVVFSDSKSVLESLNNQQSKNPLILDTLDQLEKLKAKGNTIKFCWIPSHVGIRGNEIADRRAKQALDQVRPVHFKFPHTDYKKVIRDFIKTKWQKHWDKKHGDRPNKLHEIMSEIKPFHTYNLNRKEEIIIHRIRIGHTRLSHKYLMEDPLKREPPCNYCYDEQLSIKHIMIECPHFNRVRSKYFNVGDMHKLFQKIPLRIILAFLRESGLYNLI